MIFKNKDESKPENVSYTLKVTLGGEGENPSITITESGITDWQPGNGENINSTTDAPETDTAFDSSYWNNSGETQDIKSQSTEK